MFETFEISDSMAAMKKKKADKAPLSPPGMIFPFGPICPIKTS